MVQSILVIGATGNTGQNVVHTLAKLQDGKSYRIIGLTRSLQSSSAQALAAIPGVVMEQKDWTEIDAAWLTERDVCKAFIAPHNGPTQFTEESALHLALLDAGVQYVVRISTNVKYMTPTHPVYYGRTHWAIENLLEQPAFHKLHWTSLQPNFFMSSYLEGAAKWIKEFKATGSQSTLALVPARDVSVAMVDPADVGAIAAHLLNLEDISEHNGQRYIISGPADVSGDDIRKAVEALVGEKVTDVSYKNTEWLVDLVKSGMYPEKVLPSIMAGFDCLWDGSCVQEYTPTSPAVLAIAPPRRTFAEALRAMALVS